MSITDAAVLLGAETTFGTAATLTRAYEAKADSWKREQSILESVGMRAGMAAQRSDRRKVVNMGGGGTLEIDVLTKGAGLLLQSLLGAVTGPTQEGATDAWTSEHEATKGGSGTSYTIQVLRPAVDDTVFAFTHVGSVPTSWSLAQEVGANLALSVEFDSRDVRTDVAAGNPAGMYPADAVPFDWTQAVATVDGSPVDLRTMELAVDLGRKTDRRYLRGSALKSFQKRAAVPGYSGTLEADFEDLTLYNAWVAGEILPITFTWTGEVIDAPHSYELAVVLPACQFTGESPEVSLDDLPTQPLPFVALDNGTDAVATITYTSTDTAL